MTQSPRKGAALALAVAAKAHDMMEVHRVLAYGSEEITQKTVQAMGIGTTGQWEPCEARLQSEAKRQAVQWIDGPGKTVSNGVDNEDLGVKPGGDESAKRRGAPQLDVHEPELEQQPALQERKQEIKEATLDPEAGTQVAPPNPEEVTLEAPSDAEKNTTKGTAGFRAGSIGGAAGSQRGDTEGAIGSRARDTGSAIRSRGRDTGDSIGSREEDTGGAIASRGGGATVSRGGDTGGAIGF